MDFASSHAYIGEEEFSEIQEDELSVDLMSNLSSAGLATPASASVALADAEASRGFFARRRSRSRSPARVQDGAGAGAAPVPERQQQQQQQQRSPSFFSRIFGSSSSNSNSNSNSNNPAALAAFPHPPPSASPHPHPHSHPHPHPHSGGGGADASRFARLGARAQRVFQQAEADTNVAAIKFGTLAEEAAQVFAGDPTVCQRPACGAVLNAHSVLLNKEQWTQQQQHPKHDTNSDNKHDQAPGKGQDADALDVIMADNASTSTTSSASASTSTSTSGDASRPGSPGDDEMAWVCEFCSHVNIIDAMDDAEKPSTESRDYVLAPAPTSEHDQKHGPHTESSLGSGAVIFVIDISGSMCVTTEVPGTFRLKGVQHSAADFDIPMGADERAVNQRARADVTYVSRLQCVSAAIDGQLSAWAKSAPDKQVAIVTFNNEVTIIGDGTSGSGSGTEEIVTGDKLHNDDVLRQIGAAHSIAQAKPISTTHTNLSNKLFSLQEKGQTALGPALRVATAMAAQRNGTTIFVCTDGLANIGVGALDGARTDIEKLAVEGWYESVGAAAKAAGTTISVITIAGAEARLEDLSLAVNATGGNVDRVDPLQLTQNFGDMLANPVIATQVSATFILHHGLRFRNPGADTQAPAQAQQQPAPHDGSGSKMTREIGAVSADTEITFEYQVRDRAALAQYQHLNKLPFQVQIHYTKLNGMKCVRVISKVQAVTSSRSVAERSARLDLLAANVAQASSRMAEAGQYHHARAKNLVWGKLMKRAADRSEAAPLQQQHQIYQQWIGETSAFDRSLHVQQDQLSRLDEATIRNNANPNPVLSLGGLSSGASASVSASSASSSVDASRAARGMRSDHQYAEIHKFKHKSSAAYAPAKSK